MVHLTNWLCLLSLISTPGEPAGATIILELSPLCPSRQTFVKARLIRTSGPCWGLSPFISESRCASDSRLQRHHERPSQYSSVIRTLSVLKSQDVTCRDEDLSRPRTTENLLSLDPWARERYVRFVSRVPELAGSSTWAISCEGGSSSPPCPCRSRVPTGSALSLTSDTSHCEVLVFLSRAAPGGLPRGVLFHRGKVFRTFSRANSANPWSGFNGDPFESPTLRSRPTTTAVEA